MADVKGGATLPLLINKLNVNLHTGKYDRVDVSCLCGSTESAPVTERDRYGIPHTMNLCLNCGIIYASPRMTKESALKFYEKDYRDIYDFGLDIAKEHEALIGKGKWLKDFVHQYKMSPVATVVDIGCNSGGMLEAFPECVCYGFDLDERKVSYGRARGLNIVNSDLSRFVVKADLIILNHVIEHFTEFDLSGISNILAPDGVVFIETPGLYTWDHRYLWQLAHNWQFMSTTLMSAMRSQGFQEIYCNDHIQSLWEYTGIKQPVPNNKAAVSEISSFLCGSDKVPTVKTFCKYSLRDRIENTTDTLSMGFPEMGEIIGKEAGHEAIIIGGAPSVEGYVDKIKSMNAKVISIERMYSWCLDNGIRPDYVIATDGHDDVVEGFNRVHPDTTHIISTSCKRSVLEMLTGYKTYIFMPSQVNMDKVASIWLEKEYDKVFILNTGSSVVLSAMSLAMALGMRSLHVFGFDCHIKERKYANGIAGQGEQLDEFEIEIDERKFMTNGPYLSFAQQFFQLYQIGKGNQLLDNVKIYGDSMIKAMSKIDIDGDAWTS